jgi:hypothetical protein
VGGLLPGQRSSTEIIGPFGEDEKMIFFITAIVLAVFDSIVSLQSGRIV